MGFEYALRGVDQLGDMERKFHIYIYISRNPGTADVNPGLRG